MTGKAPLWNVKNGRGEAAVSGEFPAAFDLETVIPRGIRQRAPLYEYIYTDKTSLKADREVWGREERGEGVSLRFTGSHQVSLGVTWFH